jgi:WD40 repeat protein
MLIYKAGRVAVIQDPGTRRQRFYEGHRSRISCLAPHPQKNLFASGEVAYSPSIHIWNLSGACVTILRTMHLQGVRQLVFSTDGAYIASVGADQSLQVVDWRNGVVLAFRRKVNDDLLDLVFNPYDKGELASAGAGNVTFWKMQNKHLLRKKLVPVKVGHVSALVFISYSFGE